MAARVPNLRFPLLTTISHMGHTLICMSVLPINSTTIRYGSADAGKTLHLDDPVARQLADQLGTLLNLQPHSPRGRPDVQLRLPMDIEIHKGFDGHYYMLDFSRLFPAVPLNSSDGPGMQFVRLFRKEFVVAHPVPLSPDVYSSFTSNEDQRATIATVVEAHKRLVQLIASFAADLSVRPVPRVKYNEIERDHCLDFLSLRLHVAQINSRYLGLVRAALTSQYWRLIVLVSLVVRRLKALVEETLRSEHACGANCVAAFLQFLNLGEEL
jgi:hypothetical protein